MKEVRKKRSEKEGKSEEGWKGVRKKKEEEEEEEEETGVKKSLEIVCDHTSSTGNP